VERTPIELEVREPTGLELGTFDIYMVRQKIFGGQLKARCEYRVLGGSWKRLTEYDAFAEVFWLLGEDTAKERKRRVARFGGWKTSAKEDKGFTPSIRIEKVKRSASGRHQKPVSGLFGKVFDKK
jgi:hypothetical protein